MDSNKAFIDINYIFNAKENENKSNSWKLDELRKVLNKLQNDTYKDGIKKGFNEGIKLLKNYDLDKLE